MSLELDTVYIVGAGSHGRVTHEILVAQGLGQRIVFVDDNRDLWGSKIHHCEVCGGTDFLMTQDFSRAGAVLAMGHPQVRALVSAKLESRGVRFINAIHPSAFVAKSARLGVGLTIGAQSIINADAHVDSHVIINNAVLIEHDVLVGRGSNLCPMAMIGSGSEIGSRVFISSRAGTLPQVRIGDDCVIGADYLLGSDLAAMHYFSPRQQKAILISKDFNWKKFV